MRVLCVWLPYWAVTRLRQARLRAGASPGEVLATVEAVRGVRRLVSVCPAAEAAGLSAGQALTQARALCPELVAETAEPGPDAAALADLARWCMQYTPLVAAAAPDVVWLDIAGCVHPYGGEAALAEDMARRMAVKLAARAIAATPGAAHALAHEAPCAVVEPGGEAAAIASLPVAALRLPAETCAGLRRLGLKTIGLVAGLPRAELAARFGKGLLLCLDRAVGDAGEAIGWLPAPTDWSEELRFPEPLRATEGCAAAIAHLAAALCRRLEEQRLGARQFAAVFLRMDGAAQHRAIATALPGHDAAAVIKLLIEQLDGLDPGFGIEAIELAALHLEKLEAAQRDFTRPAGNAQKLAALIDTLSNRLKPHRVWRYAPRDSHIPERAVRKAPPLDPVAAFAADPSAPRPIRLFSPPERIEAVALLPDDPPVQFRWRRALHRIRAATGPERIDPEWWTGQDSGTRDYYQVEDTEGARFWLFRDTGAWFVHGVFG